MCDIDDGDRASVWCETWRKARKQHRCDGCGAAILPGERYIVHFSKYEGEVSSAKLCAACDLIRTQFAEAHGHVTPFPGTLRETLDNCIDDGDEESEQKWKPMLAEMDARRSTAREREGK